MNRLDWEILFQGLTAVGTIGAVLVALFRKTFSNFWNRPKIEIGFKNKSPFIEVEEISAQSSDKDKIIRIRVLVTNKGNYTAKNCVLSVDSYYEARNGSDEYVLKGEFLPRSLKDHKNRTPDVIAPHLNYYFEIANIVKIDTVTDANSGSTTRQNYKLVLSGDAKVTTLGKGTFLVPIKFYSSQIKTVIRYLKIFWNSDTFTQEKTHFGVSIIDEIEFKKIKIAQ